MNYWLKKFASSVIAILLVAFTVISAFAADPKGRPKTLGPNAPSGFYIWQDDRGWHIRTTSGNEKRHFVGEIVVEGGSVNGLKQYREEQANWFKQQGNKITLDLTTDKNIDGFDFQATGTLSFKLSVDDNEDANLIRIGANSENPSGIPFTLIAK